MSSHYIGKKTNHKGKWFCKQPEELYTNGDFCTTGFDASNHYDAGIRLLEKFDPAKVWTAVLLDADQQGYPYLKRFCFEPSARKLNFLGENPDSRLLLLTDEPCPRLEVVPGGADSFRDPLEIDAETFVGVKSFRAKGKRLTTWTLETVNELEPLRRPEPAAPAEPADAAEPENLDPDSGKSDTDILDELTGQQSFTRLFHPDASSDADPSDTESGDA